MITAGIDLHQKFSFVTLMDDDGTVLKRQKVPTILAEAEKFFAAVPGEKRRAVVEPVSQWFPLYEMLERLGWEVHLAHPKKVKAIASARVKTDKIDSEILAHLLRANLLPEAYIPSRMVRDWKELVRLRTSFVRLRTRMKNSVHAILAKNAILVQVKDLFGRAGRTFLSQLELRAPYQQAKDRYLAVIDLLGVQIKATETEIIETVKEHPQAMLLTTVPGIAYFSALLIIAEIGDVSRFPDWRHLCSYAGIVPSVHASGGRSYTGPITKEGSRWLRWILIEAAQKHSHRDGRLGEMYRRLLVKKGRSTAKVAVARLMLRSIYCMLKRNEPYQEKLRDGGTLR